MVTCTPKITKPTWAADACITEIAKDPFPSYWSPAPTDSFQIQLADYPPDLIIDADVYELDLFESPQNTAFFLHGQGKKVICYINTCAWEEFRPDADDFPQEAIDKAYEGWEGEYWLDISRYYLFSHLIIERLDLAASKGCDEIDPDNINGFQQDTGFTITSQDQLAYNTWLGYQAHACSLSIYASKQKI